MLAFSILANDRSCGYGNIKRLQNSLGMAMVDLDRPLAPQHRALEGAEEALAAPLPSLEKTKEGPSPEAGPAAPRERDALLPVP